MSNANTMRITVGIDLGDKYSHVHVLGEDGETVEEGRVKTVESGFHQRFGGVAPVRVVMEVGTHSPWVSRLLASLGHEVVVANPRTVGLIARSSKKTDRHDAETLARIGRVDAGLLQPVQHRGAQAQQDLALLTARAALVRARTMLVNTVRGVVKASGGRIVTCDTRSFPKHANRDLPVELRAGLTPLLEEIASLSGQVQELDRRINRVIAERYPAARAIQQVPGVGPVTALWFVLTVDEPGRFRRSRQVGAYLGLTPRQRQSGERDPQLGISKAGNRELRTLLVQCAHYIVGYRGPDSDLRRWALARMERGGANGRKRVVVAVARKLAVLMHHLWVSGEVYRPLSQEGAA